ncbi:MAG: PEFG-CTERM sorting domain-containing protein [Nitrosopumilaceae archaeon]
MNKTKSITLTTFLILVVLVPINNVYGHGWGLDITNIDFNGRKITVSVELPQYFEESEDKIIKIIAFDEEEEQNAKNVTFLIGLYKNDKTVFRNYFFTPDGDLSIHVKPTEDGETEILAQQDSLLGAWYETEEQPIELVGPIFESGGLFHFEIELRTIDEPTNIVEDLGTYIADVSIAETTRFDGKDLGGNIVPFRMKSYFDKITSFQFDPQKNLVTFEMPFDWSENAISHIPVVHEEVHFPKEFADFLTPSYIGKVNGIKLFKSNVIVDDYTEQDERIVHFILIQDDLKYIKNQQKMSEAEMSSFMLFTLEASDKIVFPMTAYTRDEQFQIDLSWDPLEIEPGKNTKFIFTIRDVATGNPLRQSSYNFVILQNNVEVYRTSGFAQIGGEYEEYMFSESQIGPTVIRFENIRNTGLSTEFGLLVVPEFGMIASLMLIVAITSMIVLTKKFEKIHFKC